MSGKTKHGVSHITPADANIYEQLGFDRAEAAVLSLKSHLMLALEKYLEENQLKRHEAATALGVSKSAVSDLARGKTDKFSLDKLTLMLERAGKKVHVEVA